MKMIISAGGTGGHIYPALAIINKCEKMDKNFDVLYIGTHNRMENDIIPKHNIKFQSIKIYGFSKKYIGRDIKNLKYIVDAYHKCIKIMQEFKPDIVVGVGGYVTLPVIMAAKKLKIKTVIHEQNSIPGKTNLFLSKSVNKVFLSFPDSKKYFKDGVKTVHTGNPCADNVKNLERVRKVNLGFNKNKKLLIVTSGSLGSSALNDKLVEFLKMCKDCDFEILYLTGKENYDDFIKNNKLSKNIKVLPYLDNLATLFSDADLIIARAGAGTIFEIEASCVPAILVPSPNVANNHQYYNALSMSESKKAIMIEESKLDSEYLFNKVNDLLNGSNEYNEIKNNLKLNDGFCSSDVIYKEIKELVKDV